MDIESIGDRLASRQSSIRTAFPVCSQFGNRLSESRTMANGDEARKALWQRIVNDETTGAPRVPGYFMEHMQKQKQRIVSGDTSGAARLQQGMTYKLAAMAAVVESPEFKEALKAAREADRRDWLNATGMEYPDSWDEIQRQAILAGLNPNLFLNQLAGLNKTSLGEIMPIISAGLERLRLATAGTAETTHGERVPRDADRNLKFSECRQPIIWRRLRQAAGLAFSEATWTNLRKRSELKEHFRDEPGTGGKSVAISRWMAETWKLNLPEFTDETTDKS